MSVSAKNVIVAKVESLESRQLMAATYEIVDLGEVGLSDTGQSDISNKGYIVINSGNGERVLFKNGKKLRVLDELGGDGGEVYRVGVNNKGWVVGTTEPDGGDHAPVIWKKDGTVVKLKQPAGGPFASLDAYDINNKGQVVGQMTPTSDFLSKAIVWSKETAKPKNVLKKGFINNPAYAINENGDVVGSSFIILNGKFKITGNLLGLDINNKGFAVGLSGAAGIGDAAYYDGKVKSLKKAGDGFSTALSVNNNGQIVGHASATLGGDDDAIIWNGKSAKPKKLDKLITDKDWDLVKAQSINDKGQIVGYGELNGEQHFFLLNPVAKKGNAQITAETADEPAVHIGVRNVASGLFADDSGQDHKNFEISAEEEDFLA